MPKRTRPSGGSEDPVPDPDPDPSSKRTRSTSKSPSSAPPKQPRKPQKPKGAKKKPQLITLEAKLEHWLHKLPDNHSTCYFIQLGVNLGSATSKMG